MGRPSSQCRRPPPPRMPPGPSAPAPAPATTDPRRCPPCACLPSTARAPRMAAASGCGTCAPMAPGRRRRPRPVHPLPQRWLQPLPWSNCAPQGVEFRVSTLRTGGSLPFTRRGSALSPAAPCIASLAAECRQCHLLHLTAHPWLLTVGLRAVPGVLAACPAAATTTKHPSTGTASSACPAGPG
jgi:hypothetical protein